MTAKETAIKNAYESAGVDWEQVKEYVDDNGYVDMYQRFDGKSNMFKCIREGLYENNPKAGQKIRPKSLSGIETNNGWITIESENDLPIEKGDYFVYDARDGQIDLFSGKLSNAVHIVYGTPLYTHYQPIVKPKPPIY